MPELPLEPDSQKVVLFECEGLPVYRDDMLHVAPGYPGATVLAYREAIDGHAVCRSDNGAVPTLPISALSRQPFQETLDRERFAKQQIKFAKISDRDLHMWRLGVKAGLEDSTQRVQIQEDLK